MKGSSNLPDIVVYTHPLLVYFVLARCSAAKPWQYDHDMNNIPFPIILNYTAESSAVVCTLWYERTARRSSLVVSSYIIAAWCCTYSISNHSPTPPATFNYYYHLYWYSPVVEEVHSRSWLMRFDVKVMRWEMLYKVPSKHMSYRFVLAYVKMKPSPV